MKYIDEFKIDTSRRQIITVTGSGGKTTLVENMAKELVEQGKTVLIATSTKIFFPRKGSEVIVLNEEILKNIKLVEPDILYGGKGIGKDDKIIGFDIETISDIFKNENIDFILVEGDGSKQMPVKGYGGFEPVVPDETEILISVLGMNSLHTCINDSNVHRVEAFKKITGLEDNDEIGCNNLFELFAHEDGYFKVKARRNFILLNRVSDMSRKCAEEIKDKVEKELGYVENVIMVEEKKC
ncbi:probable selenium-dependent hydroxylase accessory protein YqeC [Dethiosulfatibacter aminovorans DSM 17477]|uniref:Probable selenium-dependent hydroxylase accessory protein YqeC n=1 Tax=Dethiosulfatibacter aminovorans DSM 17477 TaxID=1121476 RepID=A0A1M6G274_9FIRM|nr:selenium cofactor biosynthesis protein YqeC [Dethiosulfatibacter aminovorans]SHJ04091.1 probable selenium-dependent hydroxylase accessory protein YqeC [Dethiosulfatibacter aminovorans DSM 17477]